MVETEQNNIHHLKKWRRKRRVANNTKIEASTGNTHTCTNCNRKKKRKRRRRRRRRRRSVANITS